MRPSVLERWIQEETGCAAPAPLDRWQLDRFRDVLDYARAHSRFYQARLKDVDIPSIRTRADLVQLPFTTAEQLRAAPQDWLCCGQSQVERVVTLKTSGTTGSPKRIFFRREDQERTVEFFAHGMEELVSPGDRVLICMPGSQPGSVGDLLQRGLARIGVEAVQGGPVASLAASYALLRDSGCNSLVGIPIQMLGLAEYRLQLPPSQRVSIQSVLLSADAAHPALVERVQTGLDCQVFNHFGMTEMGFGVAVECSAHHGCHIRENDILVEVVDPQTGVPLPDGQMGEFVFTTLQRRAMPFLRYRTGDMGMLLPGRCPCGSFLRRMLPWGGRRTGGGRLWQLDGILLACPDVVDYALEGTALTLFGVIPPDLEIVRHRLAELPGLKALSIAVQTISGFSGTGMQKRSLPEGSV
ncbi:MAG: phenylacetate--CoA ligase [Lawsonibacter sp.]|nr:phenylacetate--CoA ligase [Lawsonibacter sp.]